MIDEMCRLNASQNTVGIFEMSTTKKYAETSMMIGGVSLLKGLMSKN